MSAHVWLSPAASSTALASPLTGVRVGRLVKVPSPTAPWLLSPQHRAVPAGSSAHEWLPPAVISLVAAEPVTVTGVCASVVVPLPSCPDALAPKHFSVPSPSTAHEGFRPSSRAAGAPSPVRFFTVTGVSESTKLPSPSSPSVLKPQHLAVPFASSAQLCGLARRKPPVAIAIAPARLVDATGTELEFVV